MEVLITGMIVVSSVLIPVGIGYLLAGITATIIWRYKKYVDMKYWREKAIVNQPPYDEIVGIKSSDSTDEYYIYFMKNGKRVHRDTLVIKDFLRS